MGAHRMSVIDEIITAAKTLESVGEKPDCIRVNPAILADPKLREKFLAACRLYGMKIIVAPENNSA
jgi:hypothetical protein